MKECFAVLKVHNCRCSAWGMVYSRSYVSYLIFDMICANTARLVTVGCFPLMIHSIPPMGCDDVIDLGSIRIDPTWNESSGIDPPGSHPTSLLYSSSRLGTRGLGFGIDSMD